MEEISIKKILAVSQTYKLIWDHPKFTHEHLLKSINSEYIHVCVVCTHVCLWWGKKTKMHTQIMPKWDID